MGKIEKHLRGIFYELVNSKNLIFPNRDKIEQWDKVLAQWMAEENLPLFARKGSMERGREYANVDGRKIITTDNSPAQWVFQKIIFEDQRFTFSNIKQLLNTKQIPITFILKQRDKTRLEKTQSASYTVNLNNKGWKLAHINGVALKRSKSIQLDDYKSHHHRFLSLDNMYIIDKKFSGIAEIDAFNEIVKSHYNKQIC